MLEQHVWGQNNTEKRTGIIQIYTILPVLVLSSNTKHTCTAPLSASALILC